jgi:hypothetical protein
MQVQEAKRANLSLPVTAAPSISNPRAERRATTRDAVARRAGPRGLAAGWDHPIYIAIKSLLLVVIAAVAVVLAGYSGVLPLLPATPPRMQMTGTAAHARVAPWSYCWLSPGAGTCIDGASGDSQSQAAPIAAQPGMAVAIQFSYPAPTSCTATGASAAGGAFASGAALNLAPDHPDELNTAYTLRAPAAPGTYSISIICDWNPHRSLRWLRGFGHATYTLALLVAAA